MTKDLEIYSKIKISNIVEANRIVLHRFKENSSNIYPTRIQILANDEDNFYCVCLGYK